MNSLIQSRLIRHMADRKTSHNIIKRGFTLVELMVVIVIVGILSAVALPQFLAQTKKAAATEASQIASSITKQAAAEYLYQSFTDIDSDCSDYAGSNAATTGKFTYECTGSPTEFVVTATGDTNDNNTNGVEVKMTSNLATGILGKPVTTGT